MKKTIAILLIFIPLLMACSKDQSIQDGEINDIRGNIKEIETDFIKINQIQIEILPDGSMIGSSDASASKEDWTTIWLNEQVVFTIAQITDSGFGQTRYSQGSFSDIYINDFITVKGEARDGQIYADEIEISIFE